MVLCNHQFHSIWLNVCVVTASGGVGLGHLKRCLSIAHELKRLHHDVEFYIDGSHGPLVSEKGFRVRKTIEKHDMILVDRYDVSNDMLAMYKKKCRLLARMDDASPHLFKDRLSDVIVNGNPYANKKLYSDIARSGLSLLVGSPFVPMDGKMCQARRKYRVKRNVRNITVTFGGADRKFTLRICKKIASLDLDANVTVLNGARLKRDLGRFRKLKLLPFVDNMHEILLGSDIVICSSSSTFWQVAAVGVPCITFQTADNQLQIFEYARKKKTGIALPHGSIKDGRLEKAICQLDYSKRKALSKAARKTVDCSGAQRIAARLHKLMDC
jgi:UDP-2,4-diacetamido-2,4,6-trideoxy-beta-L-altropyranose hydrolase